MNVDWNNKWILLVEDDYSSAEYLQEFLSRTNINILYAATGKQALKVFKDNLDKINIVLMDIQLPDIDGLETTKQIKAIKDSVIVIAQTAFALTSDKSKFLREGCDDYISKPIIGQILIDKLNSYL